MGVGHSTIRTGGNMKRFLAVSGVFMVLLGGVYVGRPQGHVPPFDADLRRLAETELEGFCSGLIYWQTRGQGSAADAKACRAEEDKSTEVDLRVVQLAFCRGAREGGFPGDVVTDCLLVLQALELWPTYDGQLSEAWNRAYPYPYPNDFEAAPTDGRAQPGSRTGEREELTRP